VKHVRHPRLPEPHGTQVRWQQGHRGAWRYGFINGDAPETDGSLRVWDNYTGGARSLPASGVQREARGPRGGKRWEWIEPHPETAPPSMSERPAWDPPEGPAELFNQSALFPGLGEAS